MNSMAAFALSKYRFRGSNVALLAILATLMVPPTVILVPTYLIVAQLGLVNNLWGVILPVISTPTGVFLLRQYMLTIPDELHRGGAHGPRQRVADLLAHRAAAHHAGAGGGRDLLGDVALERLPAAADHPQPSPRSHTLQLALAVLHRPRPASSTTCCSP